MTDTTIQFSIGSDCEDTRTRLFSVENFIAFSEYVLKHDAETEGKDGGYTCAPMAETDRVETDRKTGEVRHYGVARWRLNKNAQPCRFLYLDFDCKPPQKEKGHQTCAPQKAIEIINRINCLNLSAFYYETYSNTTEWPSFRLYVELSRPADGAERKVLIQSVLAMLGSDESEMDASCFTASQFMYTRRRIKANGTESNYKVFEGNALDVEEIIAANPIPERKSKEKHERLRADVAEPINPDDDPVLHALRQRGALRPKRGAEQNGDGGYYCACPFEDEHSATGDVSETVFYPAGVYNDHTDDQGEPFRIGRFHCFHATCNANHKPRDFIQAVGVNYEEYVRWCNGDKPNGFKSPATGNRYETSEGVVKVKTFTKAGDYGTAHALCGALTVEGIASTESGNNYELLVSFSDISGRRHSLSISRASLYGQNASDVIKALADGGLRIMARAGTGTANILDFLANYPLATVPTVTSFDSLGWIESEEEHKALFVLASSVIGDNSSRYRFNGDMTSAAGVKHKGTLDGWKSKVAYWGKFSSPLVLAISAAFAAPCLKLLDMEGGAFNFQAPSSKGKTKCLLAAASVYGNPETEVGNFDASKAAMEKRLSGHNDLIVCLDEAGANDGKGLGSFLYAVTNGKARGRGGWNGATNSTVMAKTDTWRTLVLSSSERTVEQLVSEADIKSRGTGRIQVPAGQRTRMPDVNACPANLDWGIFTSLEHGMTTAEMGAAVKEGTSAQYGTAGRAWLEFLVSDPKRAAERLEEYWYNFKVLFRSEGTSTQYGRVLDRFALCAAAGALASDIGMTDWSVQMVFDSIKEMASGALQAFSVDIEKRQSLQGLLRYTSEYSGRFFRPQDFSTSRGYGEAFGLRVAAYDEESSTTINSQTDPQAFMFFPDTFKEAVAPLPVKDVAEWLLEQGALVERGHQKGTAVGRSRVRICGNERKAGYIIVPETVQELLDRL